MNTNIALAMKYLIEKEVKTHPNAMTLSNVIYAVVSKLLVLNSKSAKTAANLLFRPSIPLYAKLLFNFFVFSYEHINSSLKSNC